MRLCHGQPASIALEHMYLQVACAVLLEPVVVLYLILRPGVKYQLPIAVSAYPTCLELSSGHTALCQPA